MSKTLSSLKVPKNDPPILLSNLGNLILLVKDVYISGVIKLPTLEEWNNANLVILVRLPLL